MSCEIKLVFSYEKPNVLEYWISKYWALEFLNIACFARLIKFRNFL